MFCSARGFVGCCSRRRMSFPHDAPAFSMNGDHRVRVVSLHDGDTFTAVFKLGTDFFKFPVRLARIDTCEMTSKNPILRSKAFQARGRLFEMLIGDTHDTIEWRKKDFDEYFRQNYVLVHIKCVDMDKYGRVLAEVGDASGTLVRERLAYWYDGGTKLTEDQLVSQLLSP